MTSTLRDLRRHRGWTEEKLAMMADVSTRTVWEIEKRGLRPRIETRRKLLCALGRPLSEHRDVFGPLPMEKADPDEETA